MQYISFPYQNTEYDKQICLVGGTRLMGNQNGKVNHKFFLLSKMIYNKFISFNSKLRNLKSFRIICQIFHSGWEGTWNVKNNWLVGIHRLMTSIK